MTSANLISESPIAISGGFVSDLQRPVSDLQGQFMTARDRDRPLKVTIGTTGGQ
jgi:hypothetical protein